MAPLHMYSKIQSIWAPSATYKINKWTQTEQSHAKYNLNNTALAI